MRGAVNWPKKRSEGVTLTIARLIYADIIRIIAILGVVVIHVAAKPLPHFFDQQSWWAGNIYNSLVRWSVPVFIMLSGALLLNPAKMDPLGVFFRKRFSKILWPFVFWAGIHFWWRIYFWHEKLTWSQIVFQFISGPVYAHLWFMYAIMGLYLITPILKRYLQSAPRDEQAYLLALWFFFTSLAPFLVRPWGIALGIKPEFVVGYLGYFLLGYFLSQASYTQRERGLFGVGFIFGGAVTIWQTYSLTVIKAGQFQQFYYSYFSPTVVLMAFCVFAFFRSLTYPEWLGQSRTIATLSAASFGIYLVHHLLVGYLDLRGVWGIHFNVQLIQPWLGIPITALVIFTLSLMIVFVLQRIPLIKQIVPG